MQSEILIIGAGASGLMAAYELSKQGKQVRILEARQRTGGRIHTCYDSKWRIPVELGAEFIHGSLPVTESVMQQAGTGRIALSGASWHAYDRSFYKEGPVDTLWPDMLERLGRLQQDTDIASFLEQAFPGASFSHFRQSVLQYVQGYDAAEPGSASAKALYREWTSEPGEQYRTLGGYAELTGFLANAAKAAGAALHTGDAACLVRKKNHDFLVQTAMGKAYEAATVIIALPLGVLQQASGTGVIAFEPVLSRQQAAFHHIGFGSVVKLQLLFQEAFWKQHKKPGLGDLGFLFTGAEIPTWWTAYPHEAPLMAGWLAGPAARAWQALSEEQALERALKSLGRIFGMPVHHLQDMLEQAYVANWCADPFTRGAYSYELVGSEKARSLLRQPVWDRLFFTGEYLYNGAAMGTVEAALHDGRRVAEAVLRHTAVS